MINTQIRGIVQYDINDHIEKGELSWNENGDDELQLTLKDTFPSSQDLFRANYQYRSIVIDSGRKIFSGKISDNSLFGDISSIRAVGDYYTLQEIEDYTEFWSDKDTFRFYVIDNTNSFISLSGELTPQSTVTSAPDLYEGNVNDTYIEAKLKKGTAIPQGSGIVFVYEIPRLCTNGINYAAYTLDYVLPSGFTVAAQTRDRNGTIGDTFSFVTTTTNAAQSTVYRTLTTESFFFYFLIRNNSGGTYTVTAEDNAFAIRFEDVRFLAHNTDTISGTLSGSITAGSDKTITPNSIAGIVPGDKAYLVSANTEVVTVKSVSGSTFVADVTKNHSSGEVFLIPRMCATSIIQDIANTVNLSAAFVNTPDNDIPYARYDGKSAFSLMGDFKNTALQTDNAVIRAQNGVLSFSALSDTQTYYADAQDIQLSKEYGDLVAYANVAYTTNAGIDRISGPVSNSKAVAFNSLRTRQVKSNFTISGAALTEAQNYLTNNSRVTIKSDFKVNKLYNAAGGIVDYPQMGAKIVFRNLIPALIGISDYTYQLKSATLDIVTGKKTYVIGEYLDTLPVLVANA